MKTFIGGTLITAGLVALFSLVPEQNVPEPQVTPSVSVIEFVAESTEEIEPSASPSPTPRPTVMVPPSTPYAISEDAGGNTGGSNPQRVLGPNPESTRTRAP